MTPAAPKHRTEGADAAIAEAVRLHAEVETRRAALDHAIEQRRVAVERALRLGATLRELAARLAVVPQTVRNMTSQSPAWLTHLGRLDNDELYRQGYEHAVSGGEATDNPFGPSDPQGAAWSDGWRVGSGHRATPTSTAP